jgi:hypothetical protein
MPLLAATVFLKTKFLMYDLIGDIHGYCSKLEHLLTKLDYSKINGIWQHPDRKVIFVGDYIDRGPEIRETLHLVKNMVDAGNAMAIMGNHEYNAIAYITEDANGGYLRSHNPAHNKQHLATIEQFRAHPEEWETFLAWFYTLPLFLDLGELRVVHACWDDDHINWLKERNYFTLNKQLLTQAHNRGTKENEVINETLKGKEFNIPESFTWYDKDGHARNTNRLRWWMDPSSAGYADLLFNCPEPLAEERLPADLKINIYSNAAPPVFFGHYWLEDKFPVIQADNVVCLDYSVAKEGSLVAYRWSGEQVVHNDHFVWVS